MSELTPEQKEAIDAQKAQCPFCQIVEGKIPSNKVYETDNLLAILDIRPATKGHVLLLPKEHYPIMPLIPPDTFKEMFRVSRDLSKAMQDAMLVPGTSLFIANGGAAGQQSAHFMLHIIPREEGDGADALDIPKKDIGETDIQDTITKAGAILKAMLERNLAALGYKKGTTPSQMPEKVTKDQLLQLIEQNPGLKEMIIKDPEGFKKMVPGHPQLSQLFKDISVDDIIAEITGKKGDSEGTEEEKKESDKKDSDDKKDGSVENGGTGTESSEKIDLDKIASMFK